MLSAQKTVELPLWPNGAPNSNELSGAEQRQNNGEVSNVTEPTLTVYPAARPNGMAIIMCPGGGYSRLAMNHEGHDMAPWLNTQGITYAVLKYRMPNHHPEVPLEDAEQALLHRAVRVRARVGDRRAAQAGLVREDAARYALLHAQKHRPDHAARDRARGKRAFALYSCLK